MPRPFRQLTCDQFFGLLSAFNFTRDIGEVHVHHTWRPDHSQDRGLDSVESMFRYHTQNNGWSDIAQHLTIDRNGRIWTGRSWNRTPASASGHSRGAFMYEMIGDFDVGCDSLLGEQRRVSITLSAMLLHRFGLATTDVRFHNEFNPKSCPGTSVNQDAFRSEIDQALSALASGMNYALPSRRDQIEFEALIKSFELDEGLPDDPEEAEPDHCGDAGPLAADNESQPDVYFDVLNYTATGVSEKQAATLTKVYPGPTDCDAPPQQGVLEVYDAISFSTAHPCSGEESTEPSALELAYDRALDAIDMSSFSTMDFSSGGVHWPERDENSTEYAHLLDMASQTDFEMKAEDVETLILANRFIPKGKNSIIVLGIRGSVLKSGFEAEQLAAIPLLDVRPNHVDFRCTLGFYFRHKKQLTLFAGSTVPCTYYVQNYYNLIHKLPHTSTTHCNLMPAGCYVSRVGTHDSGKIKPAVRTTDPTNLSQDATVTVLRSSDDMAFGVQDVWDQTIPYDNIHCSYVMNHSPKYGARFSSAGCSTVRGRKDPSDQWAKFQAILNSLGQGARIDYILLTGREYAIAAQLRRDGNLGDSHVVQRKLGRLRVGSQGEEVARLQRILGLRGTGYFGPSTKKRLTERQRDEGLVGDGVFSPTMDERLGWGVFE